MNSFMNIEENTNPSMLNDVVERDVIELDIKLPVSTGQPFPIPKHRSDLPFENKKKANVQKDNDKSKKGNIKREKETKMDIDVNKKKENQNSSKKVKFDSELTQIQNQDEIMESEENEDLEDQVIQKFSELEIDFEKHFSKEQIEINKLNWMIPENKNSQNSSTSTSSTHPLAHIRFDFQGNIVQKNQANVTGSLFHHGDSPEHPGYNLGEILYLMRRLLFSISLH